jgi:hypothetical protein
MEALEVGRTMKRQVRGMAVDMYCRVERRGLGLGLGGVQPRTSGWSLENRSGTRDEQAAGRGRRRQAAEFWTGQERVALDEKKFIVLSRVDVPATNTQQPRGCGIAADCPKQRSSHEILAPYFVFYFTPRK